MKRYLVDVAQILLEEDGGAMGSETGSPLRAHAFSNCEREGVMEAPFVSPVNSDTYFQVIHP